MKIDPVPSPSPAARTPPAPTWSRRDFLASVGASGFAALKASVARSPTAEVPVGINTSSLSRRIPLDDIPTVMRNELGIKIIDLESSTFGPRDPATAERFRARAEKAGCRLINLKVNAHDLPYDSEDREPRERAIAELKQWIEIAARLGVRTLRPYPSETRPKLERLIESYNRLADHGDKHGIRLLIENYKWIQTDAQVMPEIVRRMGGRIGILADTGNWADAETRRAGLAAAFPHAVTCDFKVFELTPAGEHASYDLREAFQISRRAGYNGPWCMEHANKTLADNLRELRLIKGWLEEWYRA